MFSELAVFGADSIGKYNNTDKKKGKDKRCCHDVIFVKIEYHFL